VNKETSGKRKVGRAIDKLERENGLGGPVLQSWQGKRCVLSEARLPVKATCKTQPREETGKKKKTHPTRGLKSQPYGRKSQQETKGGLWSVF